MVIFYSILGAVFYIIFQFQNYFKDEDNLNAPEEDSIVYDGTAYPIESLDSGKNALEESYISSEKIPVLNKLYSVKDTGTGNIYYYDSMPGNKPRTGIFASIKQRGKIISLRVNISLKSDSLYNVYGWILLSGGKEIDIPAGAPFKKRTLPGGHLIWCEMDMSKNSELALLSIISNEDNKLRYLAERTREFTIPSYQKKALTRVYNAYNDALKAWLQD